MPLDPSPDLPARTDRPAVLQPGPLLVIGGAEDKLRRRTILKEFVAAAGGERAHVAVVPTASSLGPEVLEVYDALFRREGASDVVPVDPQHRDDAHDPNLVARVDGSTGIFMTGGNQLKLSSILAGTPVGDAIVRAHHRGAVVAGTSAGASIQSSHMLAFGGPGTTPKQRMTQMAAGLGLLPGLVIDQHFEQRNRYGRLLMIVAQSPQLLGLGVDEDTAAVVETQRVTPDDADDAEGSDGSDGSDGADASEDGGAAVETEVHQVLRVVGRGAVTIVDGSRMRTDAYSAKRSQPILASGVVLHVLPEGAAFDLTTRTLVETDEEVEAEDASEVAAAGRDLRRMARDIAAADASPGALKRRQARLRSRIAGSSGTSEA